MQQILSCLKNNLNLCKLTESFTVYVWLLCTLISSPRHTVYRCIRSNKKTDSVLMRTVYTVYKVKSYPVQKKTNFIVEKVLCNYYLFIGKLIKYFCFFAVSEHSFCSIMEPAPNPNYIDPYAGTFWILIRIPNINPELDPCTGENRIDKKETKVEDTHSPF